MDEPLEQYGVYTAGGTPIGCVQYRPDASGGGWEAYALVRPDRTNGYQVGPPVMDTREEAEDEVRNEYEHQGPFEYELEI